MQNLSRQRSCNDLFDACASCIHGICEDQQVVQQPVCVQPSQLHHLQHSSPGQSEPRRTWLRYKNIILER